jgi:HKD family nuclease
VSKKNSGQSLGNNSPQLIDNKKRSMFDALSNALEDCERVDIAVGYFFFSGFNLLSNLLKDKKIRILVGKEIDPNCIPDIVKYSRIQD